jgi:hypothetical protein
MLRMVQEPGHLVIDVATEIDQRHGVSAITGAARTR